MAKWKLNTINPYEIIEFIKTTEFSGLISYDKEKKCLVSIVEGVYLYLDPFHAVLEIIDKRNICPSPTLK